jgi:hypothetical protein
MVLIYKLIKEFFISLIYDIGRFLQRQLYVNIFEAAINYV